MFRADVRNGEVGAILVTEQTMGISRWAMKVIFLFLMNGILLQHPALIVASLIFGAFHLMIVRENM